jgi:serine phosphatase RsbU (regulator of sigma subunit)
VPNADSAGTTAAIQLLLIEDDHGDAFLVRELLDEAEDTIDVVWAESLADAREQMALGRFDCVVLDLGLPDALGLDALQAVLVHAAGTAVIVLTGLTEQTSGTAAVAAGAQDYLIKGQVDGQLLTRSIRYAIERKRADEQLRRLYASELQAAENERLERGLLPQPITMDPRISVLTRYESGREGVLGGDFFDVVETSSGHLHVVVGDVCGHGSDAAALGVALRIAWRTLVIADVVPDEVLSILDEIVTHERQFDEIFATVCTMVIDPDRRACRLFLAGHPAPLVLGGTVDQLPDNLVGPALGVIPGVTWGSRAVDLGTNWRLMLFTDGLVEGRIGEGPERLGTDRLVEIATSYGLRSPTAELIDHLIASAKTLHGDELADDVAVVVVECNSG